MKKPHPTIQIFFPDGNPDGNPHELKLAEFTSRTIQAVSVPHSQLKFSLKRVELRNVGLYFLIDSGETSLAQ